MKKLKRGLSLLLGFIMILNVLPMSACAFGSGGLDNFRNNKTFFASTFEDVSPTDWFYDNVKTAYEYGLMVGDSEITFNPRGNIKISETITIAARLHSIYYTGKETFASSEPWYQTYVDYAKVNGIIADDYPDYNKTATRAEFAVILANALPASALPQINAVDEKMIPDVSISDTYGEAVYTLYRAGILVGNDSKGTFAPYSNIQRSEVAAIASRMADTQLRISKTSESKPIENGNSNESNENHETEIHPNVPDQNIVAPTFVIDSVDVKPGDKHIPVNIAIKNNPGISSLALVVSFDNSLSLTSLEYNKATNGQTMLPEKMSNPVKLLWINPLENENDDWVLATLYFDIPADIAPGNYQIAATYDSDDVYDINMQNVSFQVLNGSINIQ